MTGTGAKVNIGAASLVLIFIVLCLSTFGLLSLSSARSDLTLAQRSADSVRGFYQADQKGQQWLRQVDEDLKAGRLDPGQGTVSTDIPMERGQSLHIDLSLNPDASWQIASWYVYNSQEYEIDTSMPVWDGVTPP